MLWTSSIELFHSTLLKSGILFAIVMTLFGLNQWRSIYEYLMEYLKIMKFAKSLPGPKGFPIIGNILELWETDKTVEILTRIGRKLNSRFYQFWLGSFPKIIVSDPEDLEIILTSSKAANKDYVYEMMKPGVMDGLINAPASLLYRSHKNLIMPQINGNLLMSQHIKKFNKHSQILVKILNEKKNYGEFDLHDYITNFMGEIVHETIFNIEATSQLGKPNIFLELTQKLLHIVYYRMMRPWLYPDFIFRFTKKGRIFFQVVKDAHEYIDHIIADKIENYNELNEKEIPSLPLGDLLVHKLIKTKEWSQEEIRAEYVTMFVLSFETMTGIACFALLMMAMQPEIQEKAREEIKNAVRNDNITELEIADLKYIDMILRETIRMFPVAPLMPRTLNADLKLSKCTVPKGTSLFLLPYATHMDPEFWNEPEKFNPERFTQENSINRHPYAYIPFSGGMRSCPGSKYGMTCLKVLLTHILRNYQLDTAIKFESLRIHYHISTRCIDGYRVSLRKI